METYTHEKYETLEIENIIDSFIIDPADRMLNFHVAILNMIKHKISPIELFTYIDDEEYWASDDNEKKRYHYLNDTIFACKVNDSYYRNGGE